MWTIDKSFTFEMGHRVWAQQLNNPDLSISTNCACKHLHGHSYTVKVFLEAEELDQSAMVTDFKNLNFMKEFLDNELDHKFMIDVNDPNFEYITGCEKAWVECYFADGDPLSKHADGDNDDEQEHLDSFVLVSFVPTSENICKFLYEYAEYCIGRLAKVVAVELWETAKSHCRYER